MVKGKKILNRFDEKNFEKHCNTLANQDADIKLIIDTHGLPPMWKRKHGFETLLHIILEQQVSLASAKAALNKLKQRIGTVTPQKVIALTDAELRACYFSRQKIIYAKHLSQAVISKQLNFRKLAIVPDDEARTELKKIKGIGDWTVDVYLMMVLQRPNLFPLGDIALINSIKEIKNLPRQTSKEYIQLLADRWKPYRTVAAFILWHSYLCKRNREY